MWVHYCVNAKPLQVGNLARIIRGKPVAFMSRLHVTEYTVGQVKEQLAHGGFELRKILSKPIREGSAKANVAKWIFSRLISLCGSHHQLEATVFYLAQETSNIAEQDAALNGNSAAPL